jgi:hypothetical protein
MTFVLLDQNGSTDDAANRFILSDECWYDSYCITELLGFERQAWRGVDIMSATKKRYDDV